MKTSIRGVMRQGTLMMLDFNHGVPHPAYADLENQNCSERGNGKTHKTTNDLFNAAIDDGLVEQHRLEPLRDYLGVSSIGKRCARQIQYDYQKVPKDEGGAFSGRTLRKFASGHYYEADTAKLIKAAGFDLRVENSDGTQFGFKALGGKFAGHIDGVICGGPDWLSYPCLWEHKAVGNKSFAKHVKTPVGQANPVYAGQIALYQAYLELTQNPAVLTVRNTDTQELYWELVPFDGPRAQSLSDKAVTIIKASQANELLPRAFAQSTHFECKWCAWSKRCWDCDR